MNLIQRITDKLNDALDQDQVPMADDVAHELVQLYIDQALGLRNVGHPDVDQVRDLLEVGYRMGRAQGRTEGWNEHLERVREEAKNL